MGSQVCFEESHRVYIAKGFGRSFDGSAMSVVQPSVLKVQALLFLSLPVERRDFFDVRYSANGKGSSILSILKKLDWQKKPLLRKASFLHVYQKDVMDDGAIRFQYRESLPHEKILDSGLCGMLGRWGSH